MKKRRGFTLIELVMVVAILGVLSSVALVKYTDVSEKSKKNSDYITASNIATAAKLALNDGENIESIEQIGWLVEKGYLEGMPIVQSINGIKDFNLAIEKSNITVSAGTGETAKRFYPKPIESNSN